MKSHIQIVAALHIALGVLSLLAAIIVFASLGLAGGIVISPDQMTDLVPVQLASKGVVITQFDLDSVSHLGLVKIDLLGNRSLGVIRDAIHNVRSNGVAFDEARWEPEDDIDTQTAIAQGHTMGCFYIESPAQSRLNKKAQAGSFEEIAITSSLIRPAGSPYSKVFIDF